MTNSATGGFLQPIPQPPPLNTIPANLTLVQFIQTLLVGLSAFPGPHVRPEWQVEPGQQPDLPVNWLAFGVQSVTPDANAYVGINAENIVQMQRNELLEIALQIYGPAAYDNMALIRDGLQLPQNAASLKAANMGFAFDSPAIHVPDFVNGRWIDRYRMDIFLRRQIQRTYPILTFLSASGTVYTQTAENSNFQQTWKVST